MKKESIKESIKEVRTQRSKDEILKHIEQGKTLREIATLINKSYFSTSCLIKKLGLTVKRKDHKKKYNVESKFLKSLIDQGYTKKEMCEILSKKFNAKTHYNILHNMLEKNNLLSYYEELSNLRKEKRKQKK